MEDVCMQRIDKVDDGGYGDGDGDDDDDDERRQVSSRVRKDRKVRTRVLQP